MKKRFALLICFVVAGVFIPIQKVSAETEIIEFKITTWNALWLSCNEQNPSDDNLQINNVASVIRNMNSDVVALQEVGTSDIYATIDTLVKRLGSEWSGNIVVSKNGNCQQNQGLLFKKEKIQLINSSLITNGGTFYNWSSGRYPALYNINLLANKSTIPVSLINIHAKAMGDTDSYSRRKAAAEGLKTLLDGSGYNTKNLIILGDFNDYLVGTQCSTCSPNLSPYKNFMDDTENYRGITAGLTDPSFGNNPVIDNIIISNELFEIYKENSANREVAATQTITNYSQTTSDHTPVSSKFNVTVEASGCKNLQYTQNFTGTLDDFTQNSVKGDQAWVGNSTYGAEINGYYNGGRHENEDWLISPSFNLSGKKSATLSFQHTINFCSNTTALQTNHTLWVSDNFNGNFSEATWTQLAIPIMPQGTNYTPVNSGNIVFPPVFLSGNIHFAFKYLSTTDLASKWQIKDLQLKALCPEGSNLPETALSDTYAYASEKSIYIKNAPHTTISIYNIMGHLLWQKANKESSLKIDIPSSGIYLIRIENKVYKVILK